MENSTQRPTQGPYHPFPDKARNLESFVLQVLWAADGQKVLAIVEILSPVRVAIESLLAAWEPRSSKEQFREYRNKLWRIFVLGNREFDRKIKEVLGVQSWKCGSEPS